MQKKLCQNEPRIEWNFMSRSIMYDVGIETMQKHIVKYIFLIIILKSLIILNIKINFIFKGINIGHFNLWSRKIQKKKMLDQKKRDQLNINFINVTLTYQNLFFQEVSTSIDLF